MLSAVTCKCALNNPFLGDTKENNDAIDSISDCVGWRGGGALADQYLHTDGNHDQENPEWGGDHCSDPLVAERLRVLGSLSGDRLNRQSW